MANTQSGRLAVRERLRAAGIITAAGDVDGAKADRPDAAIFALIEEFKVAWSSYTELRRTGRGPDRKPLLNGYFEQAWQARAKLDATRATTRAGAVAKAELVMSEIDPRGKSGVPTPRLFISAIRDALWGPAATIANRSASLIGDDGPLFALLEEFEAVREIAEPDEPRGHKPRPSRDRAMMRFLELEKQLCDIQATSPAGVTEKLRAAMPSDGPDSHFGHVRPAIADLLRFPPQPPVMKPPSQPS